MLPSDVLAFKTKINETFQVEKLMESLLVITPKQFVVRDEDEDFPRICFPRLGTNWVIIFFILNV